MLPATGWAARSLPIAETSWPALRKYSGAANRPASDAEMRTNRIMSVLEDHTFYRRYGKRWFDAALGLIMLLIALIPMALIAIAILLLSGSPVIFRQKRTGVRGTPFVIFKFRTMSTGARPSGSITVAGDGCITPFGTLLRRYKLDELPQLVNVLIGDMSLVGPRPDVAEYTDFLTGADRQILQVRPRITGPASVAFRDVEHLLGQKSDPEAYDRSVVHPAKLALNRTYLENVSFRTDLRWII